MSTSNEARSWLLIFAGLLGATAVALGAFHAHGMQDWLSEKLGSMPTTELVAKRMEQCGTGLKYHLAHAAAILGLAVLSRSRPDKWVSRAGGLLIVGTVLFSGSLYMISLFGMKIFGAVAPLGGLSLIMGWIMVTASGLRRI